MISISQPTKLENLIQSVKPLPEYIPLENFKQLFTDEEIFILAEQGIIAILTDNRVWKIYDKTR